ncbi:MAG: GH3 auxin-responsive promoter family protein [Bacteroidota bacterium]
MTTLYPKKILKQLVSAGRRLSQPFSLTKEKAYRQQVRTLKKLLIKSEMTDYGKKYGFSKIIGAKTIYRTYQQLVPITDYSKMHDWWQKAYNGAENVTWPGKIEFFALSSGTSEGASKYIPVSQDMIKSITRAGLRQIISIAKTDLPKDYLTKNYLMLGGSTSLYFNDEGKTYAGDLSGITSSHVPNWFERFSKPSNDIRSVKNWQDKIDRMVDEAPQWDVVVIAGVPAWIQILFEEIIKRYKLKTIHDLWPNLSVYLWGGVAIEPYRKSLNALMEKPIMYLETYLASEGFVAFQTSPKSPGMRLNFRNGMFFEFIPFNEHNFDESGNVKPNAIALSIKQVELNKEYALVLTTCAGTWRYIIGDTIKFVDIEDCQIKITGRTKHFLSLCGEHLSVDNMNKAIERLSEHLDISINEYTVKGITNDDSRHSHQWYIACDNPTITEEEVTKLIDGYLIDLNDDYATERKHALKEIRVKLLPSAVFLEWMQVQGKFGSQSKFPRVLSNVKYSEWVEFLNKTQSVKLAN